MARVTRAASYLSLEEVKTRLKLDPRPWCRQRWLIIYNALVEPRAAAEIAKHTGMTVAMVHQVISTYNRFGVAAVETPGTGGRRHQYLTLEDEQAFLAPFFSRAEQGEIVTAGEIQQAFEARIGHEVEESTIYRLLSRHHWRKPVPRPVQKRKSSLKKLRRDHRGDRCEPPSRRQATCLKDGAGRGAFWSDQYAETRLGATWDQAESSQAGHS
jgi:transposase